MLERGQRSTAGSYRVTDGFRRAHSKITASAEDNHPLAIKHTIIVGAKEQPENILWALANDYSCHIGYYNTEHRLSDADQIYLAASFRIQTALGVPTEESSTFSLVDTVFGGMPDDFFNQRRNDHFDCDSLLFCSQDFLQASPHYNDPKKWQGQLKKFNPRMIFNVVSAAEPIKTSPLIKVVQNTGHTYVGTATIYEPDEKEVFCAIDVFIRADLIPHAHKFPQNLGFVKKQPANPKPPIAA